MKMKFGEFIFPSNPCELEVALSANVSIKPIFGKSSKTDSISVNPLIVRGSGVFYGDEAENTCLYLQHMLRLREAYPLFLPSYSGFNAYLTEFTYKKNAGAEYASYSFVFTERCSDKAEKRSFCFTQAQEGENAFVIAARCNVSVNDIMRLNDFMTPFDIKAGERVMLR